MLFPTFLFGVFFLGLFALIWAVGRANEWRKILLLVGSWVFYGAWDARFVALLIASGVLNWGVARLISRSGEARNRKRLVIAGVTANLGILAYFKYYNFFFDQVGTLLRHLGWERDLPVLQVIVPVGVSFFTFQGMSYLIDVYRGKIAPARLLDVTLLMSFFAHLVAGPIVRGADLLPQFERGPSLDRVAATRGLLMIVWGLFKKIVIASQLATLLVDPVFFEPGAHSAIDLIAGAYGYAVQIYCDFSAYSDMAIGLAALLGYSFPRNFDQPYRSTSLQEFWRRWHISLSSWLRDYLYFPLGGSRGGLLMICRNLMITMVLGGIWHGAAWTFAVWGALHGAALCVERIWRRFKPGWLAEPPKWLALIVTFNVVCLGWIFFRAQTFQDATDFLAGLGRWSVGDLTLAPLSLLLIVGGLALHALPPRLMESVSVRASRTPAIPFGLAVGLCIFLIDAVRPEGVAPFIYYQF